MLLPPSSRPMLDLMVVVTAALALPAPLPPLPLALTLDKPDDEPGRLVPGSRTRPTAAAQTPADTRRESAPLRPMLLPTPPSARLWLHCRS